MHDSLTIEPDAAAGLSARPPVLAAMRDPATYPHQVGEVEVVETHMSWVFLAGAYAYKIKKPIELAFVDQRDPLRRRELCEREVRLNSRLASAIYLGVRGLAPRDGGWRLCDPRAPDVEEFAVEMRRFDESQTLAARVGSGEIRAADIGRIGQRIAWFHHDQRPLPAAGTASALLRTVHENLAELDEFTGTVLAPERLAQAQRFAAAFAVGGRALLDSRAVDGLVRDGHGDMRAEHVLLDDHGVQIFDCLEFDRSMRQIDVGADLAFLAMELEAQGRGDLAELLVSSYRRMGGDPGPPALFAFFVAHRAWVRCKVACLRRRQLAPSDPGRARLKRHALELADLGRRAAWRARGPLTLVVCGGTATGKTFLARHLAQVAGLEHVNSDVVRKRQWGLAPDARAPAQAYGDEANRRVYAELGLRARAAGGPGAVVDATFRHRADRHAFMRAYGSDGPAPVFVECRAALSVVRGRAEARWWSQEPTASDADPGLVDRQRAEFAPLDEVDATNHLAVRTDQAVAHAEDIVTALFDARLARLGPA